eukprot:GEMP01029099.1.p1 GENE.GEMP01029099.1~~GEMP01029099.1.p1  ORF type:complete len:485 (+),score=77.17 GEMP01029099.1:91-1545(+)
MGARPSRPGVPILRAEEREILYFPPKFRKILADGDCFLLPGMVVNVRGTPVHVRRNWVNSGFEVIQNSKVGLVVIDAFVGGQIPKQSVLYFLGQRVCRICSLSAPRSAQVIPRIPVFVFPRSKEDGDECQRCLLQAGLPINDIIVANHSVTSHTLAQSPLVERMIDRGLEYVHVIDCSNFFEVPCDPLILGFTAENEADFCSKTVKREQWDEDYPLYVLKMIIPQDSRADSDEMAAVIDKDTCDEEVLKMTARDFFSFRRNDNGNGQSSSSDDNKSMLKSSLMLSSNTNNHLQQDVHPDSARESRKKGLAFNYSALPSFMVSTKVLYDCQTLGRGHVNITDFCQKATSMLVPRTSLATTYSELEEFLETRNTDVRDDSLLVILSMTVEWEKMQSRSYDSHVDERLDNIKEYSDDRCVVYESRSPRFHPNLDLCEAALHYKPKAVVGGGGLLGWRGPFMNLCCLQNVDDMVAVEVNTIDLVASED